MTVPIRNHDIAELKRLDLAHHLPAQTDYKLQPSWAAAGSSPGPTGSTSTTATAIRSSTAWPACGA
jgi:hypothetical protein